MVRRREVTYVDLRDGMRYAQSWVEVGAFGCSRRVRERRRCLGPAYGRWREWRPERPEVPAWAALAGVIALSVACMSLGAAWGVW
jgi:hypothetical protein